MFWLLLNGHPMKMLIFPLMIIFRVTQVCCWACFWYHWWYQLPWLQWCQALACVSVAAWVTVGSTPWSPLCSEEELEELWDSYMCLDRWAVLVILHIHWVLVSLFSSLMAVMCLVGSVWLERCTSLVLPSPLRRCWIYRACGWWGVSLWPFWLVCSGLTWPG